ncbi:sulfite exporter TauE/SafE family protein [Sphingomonas japonica]|uniref:Probable membrane transporter protein n=1 Tax=Sphingomonas japonica TaxID=511662 RepID=A0ABX0U1M2_9SPHN|nr:sulfite exporter TauE/SafE family protein [Sphingomonas japonica]NIJ23599.1 putative membrane protein YfcA [Sphingomonas japonica]
MAGRIFWAGIACFAAMYAALWAFAPIDGDVLRRIWFMPAIGVLGATIANTSGTGGGVVFIPVFNILRIEGVIALAPVAITASSFLIQCFGMSMGSLRWGLRVHAQLPPADDHHVRVRIRDFWTIVGAVIAISAPVMLATQRLAHFAPHNVLIAFKAFSILLGLTLIATAWTVNRKLPEQPSLKRIDLIVLLAMAPVGGFITALFSVGIGEMVALYLFIRHYPILLSTGAATVLSALSCLMGAVWHIEAGTVPWEVVALAAPGALVGGFIARPIALWLGSLRLKTLDGAWIVLSSCYLIWVNR